MVYPKKYIWLFRDFPFKRFTMIHHLCGMAEAFDDAIKAMFLEGASHMARKPQLLELRTQAVRTMKSSAD